MNDLISERKLLNVVIWAVLIGVASFATLPIFVMLYLEMALILIVVTWIKDFPRQLKSMMTLAYLLLVIFQISFCVVASFGNHLFVGTAIISRIFSTGLILLPFILERSMFDHNNTEAYLPTFREMATLSFAELKENGESIRQNLQGVGKLRRTLALDGIKAVIADLHRHSSVHYINDGTLTESYFERAKATLTDPYMYLVISHTGSNASDIISLFTKKQYNHTSLSFDEGLQTAISYNGGNNVYPPGLNSEMIEAFHQADDASLLVYRLSATSVQKQAILEHIRHINEVGSAYNIIGLVLKHSLRPNIMFCSQFVYQTLASTGLAYFKKADGMVKPTDFIEQDYYKKLDFCYEIKF
ncbi:hypothetical protein FC15_GL000664 [Lapidilactobacillus concavus DSM 17758]|uniref:Uncharacterized protein n=1 Tax=Lapidilactobacillus concavus DSM 17758 TaxID=1423735 RepID=A0A0R1VRG7_9LACO|nr:hypothetical protein [Lapidilactobacillus concavus]KRM08369.1 hypothetical protein FC15_GL000664 [Lapidilactobacillus concavus DSM 17758]GEL13860.1 hypothetical protein LCO01nite_14090 [Lapidilactobacillus concavus]